jgi:hypothetical protein
LIYQQKAREERKQQQARAQEERRQFVHQVMSEAFTPCEDFEHHWITSSDERIGLKYQDGPGCYVILIFDEPVIDGDFQNYQNVYIGQSVKMFQRVHNHFNGKGNGDVYADVRAGKYVYVQCIFCPKEQMNSLEKRLIASFDAQLSYNQTRGGGMSRS